MMISTLVFPQAKQVQQYRVIKDLFVIPDKDNKFILYAPFLKTVLSVNQKVVTYLRDIQNGNLTVGDDSHFFVKQLIQAGILVEENDFPQTPSFPSKKGDFDPKGLSLFLTTRCSMACSYCYADGGSSTKVMDWNIAQTAIDWIISHTKNQKRTHCYLTFHGGGDVSTVKPLFKQCVTYARQQATRHGIKMRIDAGLNGVMSLEMVDWVASFLNGATVSLDGMPKVHNKHRPLCGGKDSFDVVARTLHRMDMHRFSYGIRATVTPDSVDYLPESIDYICQRFAVRTIQAEPVFSVGRATNMKLAIDPVNFVEKYRQAEAIAKSYNKLLKYSGARLQTLTNQFCNVSSDSMSVTCDGKLTACFEVTETSDNRWDTFCYGSVDVNSGSIDIDMVKLNRLRSLTVEHKPYCENCFCKWHCAGDCAAKLASLDNAWDPSVNPRCWINRELTKDQLIAYLAR